MKLKLIPEVMTSKQIAELTGKRHDNVKRTIDDVVNSGAISQPQSEGRIRGKNGVVEKSYVLDERSAIIVVAQLSPVFTAKIVDEFKELQAENQKLKDHIATRKEAGVEYRNMCSAIQTVRALEGKPTPHHVYSNEAEMLNRIVLGCTSKQFCEMHGVDTVRDNVSALELAAFTQLEKSDEGFVLAGFTYEQRKLHLESIFIRVFNERLVAQQMLEHA